MLLTENRNLYRSICLLLFSAFLLNSCGQSQVKDEEKYFAKSEELLVIDLIKGHWYFPGTIGTHSSTEKRKSLKIEFFLQNDSLKFKSNSKTLTPGEVDFDRDLYINPTLSENFNEGIVSIINAKGKIILKLQNKNGSVFKSLSINIPVDYKKYLEANQNNTIWNFIETYISYEKMILSKYGRKFNHKEGPSLIFIQINEHLSWSEDYTEMYVTHTIEDLYNIPQIYLEGKARESFLEESDFQLGHGYKLFIPNITKYDQSVDSSPLSLIQKID